MLNHFKIIALLNVEVFFRVFWEPFWPHAPKRLPFLVQNMHLFCSFWEPFATLRATFGRLLVTKVVQRLQKVSQKRPNGPKAPQKGSEKTTWLPFLHKFDVFSTIFSFSFVLAFIWLLLAPIGSSWLLLPSICAYCFRLSPIASSLLLLSPIGS